ncbi:MAG: DUF11 domain-containing protein [Clostridia bacterium]|nr:DUF11 domain-containing protein [Clostridia bacterium]
MFGNLKNLNKGRIRVKLIAIMLVMTLTFANFALVGSHISEVIAAGIDLGSQTTETNSENVSFDVYFEKTETGTIREKEAEINSEDVNLNISVNVKNEGYLQNAVLELLNSNFEFKNDPEKTTYNLDKIQANDGITVRIPVVAKKDEAYNLSLLNMQSQIKLTGEYVAANGTITDIETIKAVQIKWTTDSITEDDIELEKSIITNKVYSINGSNKRIVQMLVTIKLKDNKAPVHASGISIKNPETGIEPEEVKVAAYSTKATNGRTYLEFNDGETSTWEYGLTYDGEDRYNATNIVAFNYPDNNNEVYWEKDCADEYVVTYVYDGNTEVSSFNCDITAMVLLHGRTDEEDYLEKTNTLTVEKLEEIGDVINLKTEISENIYKGKLYINGETTYEIKNSLYIPYSNVIKTIATTEGDLDRLIDVEGNYIDEEDGVEIYYKSIKVNAAQARKVLGTTGTIKIYDIYSDEMPKIGEIVLSEEPEEEYYEISFENLEKEVNVVGILTSPAQTEGILDIIIEKTIKVSEPEIIPSISKLTVNQAMTAINVVAEPTDDVGESDIIAVQSNESSANFLEPVTTFDISLDKNTLSTQVENELEITTELKSNESRNKLFGDSTTIKIELPKEITEASLENITPVLYDDELTLDAEASKIVTNSETGNKELVIVVKGPQTKYNTSTQNATIKANLKVKTNEFMASKDVVITATCINGAENVQSKENVKLVSKTGLITRNTLTLGENIIKEINNNNLSANITESTNANISTTILNNFGENISNINIVGNIPEGATLTNAILSGAEGVTVSYSEDSNTWVTEVADYSKVKFFKISLAELVNGETVDLNYALNINVDSIEENVALVNNLNVGFTINEQEKQETIKFTLNVIKNEVEPENPETPVDPEQPVDPEEPVIPQDEVTIAITPKTTTNTLHEGQVVTYEIKVTNTSAQTLNNVTLDYIVPQGAVVTDLTYAQATEMTFTDSEITNKQWTIETLNSNKSITKEITLRIKDGATEIVNSANLKDSEGTIIAQCTNQAVSVIEGDLTARMSRRDNLDIPLSNGSTIQYIVIVTNNTNFTMNNVAITSQVPNQTEWIEDSEYNQDWNYNENTRNVNYTIDTLNPGETKDIRFEVKVARLENNSAETEIENIAVVKTSNGKQYETNIYTSIVLVPKWNINMTSTSNENLKEGETIKYIIKVLNSGKRRSVVSVIDDIPNEIAINRVTYYIGTQNKNSLPLSDNKVNVIYPVDIGETLTIEIEGTIEQLEDSVLSKQIANVAKINLGDGEYLESNKIVNTIINKDNQNNPNDPSNPGDSNNPSNPGESNNPSEAEKNTISGLAWLDENKNGIRDNQEKVLQSLKVLLLDNKGNVKVETETSLTGTYKFADIENGEYIVVFKYDSQKYGVTKYQVEGGTNTINSDAISRELLLNNENVLVGMTDTIKIENNGAASIDIGLIENPQFDLSLNKYISKVVTTNKEGTTTYEYENTELAKVELGAKYIAGTVLLVEYEIEVSNDGDVNAYVTDIVDYLPSELEFNSEMNSEWYLGTDNNLHYMALDPEAIEPGKTQKVKLVLTKTLKNNSAGTIENTAEIGEGINLEGIKEIDSTAGNKQDGEDDLAKATLIISIRTGSPIMYIGIVLASMIILGTGIYIIDKKVLKVRI